MDYQGTKKRSTQVNDGDTFAIILKGIGKSLVGLRKAQLVKHARGLNIRTVSVSPSTCKVSSFLLGPINTKTLPVSSAIFEPSPSGQLKGKPVGNFIWCSFREYIFKKCSWFEISFVVNRKKTSTCTNVYAHKGKYNSPNVSLQSTSFQENFGVFLSTRTCLIM